MNDKAIALVIAVPHIPEVNPAESLPKVNALRDIQKRARNGPIAGYTNAITTERIDYVQVKEYSTYLSTALVKSYGLKQGETVALFSPNTIWYPVAMFGALRAGTGPDLYLD
ncbi:MAG: hypothetical protein Q9219_001947 [cf. Caloplaca sp. 3 TL-2023]